MKGDDLADRLLDFAVRIIRLAGALPKSQLGRHINGQLVRSGTSAGANYEEARGAESRADFIHITPATFIFITDGAFLRFSASFQRIKRLPE